MSERWIDANGVTVYEKGRRSSKTKVLLTKEELLATKILLNGTVTKSGTVFKAPFVKANVRYHNTIMDTEMNVALFSGDPRVVAALILKRTGCITWWKRGDNKRSENYGRQKQTEMNNSDAAQKHLQRRDELCVEIRNHSSTSARYQELLSEIHKLDESWYRNFGVFDKERLRMAKQLEIKKFLKLNRHRFSH